jgi:hypothetical protein
MTDTKIILIGKDEDSTLDEQLLERRLVTKDNLVVKLETTIGSLIDYICKNKIRIIVFRKHVDQEFIGNFGSAAWETESFFKLEPTIIFCDDHLHSFSPQLEHSLNYSGIKYGKNEKSTCDIVADAA